MSHQNMSCWPVVCAWRVCRLFLIIRRTAYDRLGTTSRHGIYACEVGVMRLLRSSLSRDATRVHIIHTSLRQRRCLISWTILVVMIPLNHHPGLCSLTYTRGRSFGVRGHDHLTSRAPGVPLRGTHGVLPGLRVREKLDLLPTSCRLSLESVCCLIACPALSSRWPGALDTYVPFGLHPQEGVKSS